MLILPIDAESEKIETIADNYGICMQTIKAIEELAELQQSLCKLTNDSNKVNNYAVFSKLKNETIEEIADVVVMLNQILYLYTVPYSDLSNMVKAKIDRQLKRIEEGQ